MNDGHRCVTWWPVRFFRRGGRWYAERGIIDGEMTTSQGFGKIHEAATWAADSIVSDIESFDKDPGR